MYEDELRADADIVQLFLHYGVDNGVPLWQTFIARKGGRSHSGHCLEGFQGEIEEKLRKVRIVAKGRYVTKISRRVPSFMERMDSAV